MDPVQQSGAIVFRFSASGPQVLLVRAKTDAAWIFPKGHLKAAESPEKAALRETSEEAGVHGILISPAGALSFTSGTEAVSVQYFLIYATAEEGSPEGRDKQWCSPSEAMSTLTHADARRLLASVFAEIQWWDFARARDPATDRFSDLMIAEYEHVAESLLANEESGEKRATFFLTLSGGIGAALAFVVGRDHILDGAERLLIAMTLAILLLLGYATFLRVITRNAASDKYKRRLSRARQYFLKGVDDPRERFLTFSAFAHAWRDPTSAWALGKGGWFETMALVEAVVGGALGGFLAWWWADAAADTEAVSQPVLAVVGACGVMVGALLWFALIKRANVLYAREMLKPH